MTTLSAKLKSYSSKQLLKIVEKNDERKTLATEILIGRGVIEAPKKKAKKQSAGLSLEVALNIQATWRNKKGEKVKFIPFACNGKGKDIILEGEVKGATIDKRYKNIVIVKIKVENKIYHKVPTAIL